MAVGQDDGAGKLTVVFPVFPIRQSNPFFAFNKDFSQKSEQLDIYWLDEIGGIEKKIHQIKNVSF